MSISFPKYKLHADSPTCCGTPMHRAPKFTVLREPATSLRLMGHTCPVCKRTGVTDADMQANQKRALLVAARVRQPSDLYRLMKSDGKD